MEQTNNSTPTDTQQEYKLAQQKRISLMQVGNKDALGNQIIKIFVKSDEFIIYEIETNNLSESLRVIIDTETEKDENGLILNFNKVKAKFIEIKGLLYKVVDDYTLKSRLAHILSLAIKGDIEIANNQFDLLIKEINSEYQKQFMNKFYFTLTAFIFVLINISISIALYFASHSSLITQKSVLIDLIYVLTCGSIGGMFSLSLKLKKINLEKGIPGIIFYAYGIERIIIAMFASFIAYLAILTDFAFSFLKNLPNPIYGLMIIGIVAGFSESFVPNLLLKIEEKQQE